MDLHNKGKFVFTDFWKSNRKGGTVFTKSNILSLLLIVSHLAFIIFIVVYGFSKFGSPIDMLDFLYETRVGHENYCESVNRQSSFADFAKQKSPNTGTTETVFIASQEYTPVNSITDTSLDNIIRAINLVNETQQFYRNINQTGLLPSYEGEENWADIDIYFGNLVYLVSNNGETLEESVDILQKSFQNAQTAFNLGVDNKFWSFLRYLLVPTKPLHEMLLEMQNKPSGRQFDRLDFFLYGKCFPRLLFFSKKKYVNKQHFVVQDGSCIFTVLPGILKATCACLIVPNTAFRRTIFFYTRKRKTKIQFFT